MTLMARHQWTGFYVRLHEPAQGGHPAIGGIPPQPGMAVALLDDLAATGSSLRPAVRSFRGSGRGS